MDGSHRAFQNSDATVFFLETPSPAQGGVTVHIHDMFLPFDLSALVGEPPLLRTVPAGGLHA